MEYRVNPKTGRLFSREEFLRYNDPISLGRSLPIMKEWEEFPIIPVDKETNLEELQKKLYYIYGNNTPPIYSIIMHNIGDRKSYLVQDVVDGDIYVRCIQTGEYDKWYGPYIIAGSAIEK